jgi:hypothetical protein
MLGRAVVCLQAGEVQMLLLADELCQADCRLARRHAAPFGADVDFDQHVERRIAGAAARFIASACHRLFESRHLLRIVDANRDPRSLSERRHARHLRGSDDLIGDQHIANAAVDQRLGLAHLLAADADGAMGDLGERDRRALMRLGMRTKPTGKVGDRLLHQPQVRLEGV